MKESRTRPVEFGRPPLPPNQRARMTSTNWKAPARPLTNTDIDFMNRMDVDIEDRRRTAFIAQLRTLAT